MKLGIETELKEFIVIPLMHLKDMINKQKYMDNIYIKEKFVNEVMTFDYPKEMLEDFINYWTEGKRKMRFQKQTTFEIKLRLVRWAKNQKQWNKPKAAQSKIHAQLNAYLEAKKLI